MTIEAFIAHSVKRDSDLVKYLCGDAKNIREDLRTWIQDEVTGLITTCDLRETMEPEGPLKEVIETTGRRLRDIKQNVLPAAIKRSQEVEEEIEDMGSHDLGRSYTLLMDAQAELHQLLGELLRIRDDIANIAQ